MAGAVTDTQQRVFAFLSDPTTHGCPRVKRIDTHAASVFLAGDRVYKVKRAVRFPFLDYSTLAKRKAACEAELAVNQPFAPQIYLRVLPITHTDGQLVLGGEGAPVEWAVEMHRFDEDATLDHLADRGKLDPTLADALARTVTAAHARASAVEAAPWLDALARFIEQNDSELRAHPGLFATRDIEALTASSRAALGLLLPLLRARGAEGLIRRVHGDLHLGNIALIDGQPVPFDAIEFDPVIASGDVFYDLAFLLMDLIERRLKQAANVVLNRYLTESRRDSDLDALAALPLFMSLRAAIRAKVTAARLDTGKAEQRDSIANWAQRYFRLACELIKPPAPTLLAVGGLSGTGKSVLARALAADIPPAPGAVVLRSDVERKALFGVAETERLPAESYTPEANAKVYDLLYARAQRIIAAGHSAIVDAVFARQSERAALEQVASARGVAFRGLFLTADLEARTARLGGRTGDASDADANVARHQERYDLGLLTWTQVDASGTAEETLRHARAALAR